MDRAYANRQNFLACRKPAGPCDSCGKRPATTWWSGENDFMAVNRGAPVAAWCKRCAVVAQIAHVEKQAARLPELRAELLLLDAEEGAGLTPP